MEVDERRQVLEVKLLLSDLLCLVVVPLLGHPALLHAHFTRPRLVAAYRGIFPLLNV